ncbi:hypothetical protein FOA43_001161 [Brettanomyces nanus]|uniref:Uncharacterized protein n=1 Tax=Eeniella nana TaxID=13502 RepID=A0A875RXP2_EENNA|nr:uncharacterized protein FOA43_001161 [Brettanomyces nanus]QPG73846.1 hypothetical protein FOA43_001161 [Brettanomyces nanus]
MKILTEEEKEIATHLKASIWYTVSKVVEQQTKKLSRDSGGNLTATPQFVAALVELVYRQLTGVGEDLAMFANHARRKTITPDDMYMIVRKNEDLKEILKNIAENETKEPRDLSGSASHRAPESSDNVILPDPLKNIQVKQESHHKMSHSGEEDTFSDMGDYI